MKSFHKTDKNISKYNHIWPQYVVGKVVALTTDVINGSVKGLQGPERLYLLSDYDSTFKI